MVALIVLGAFTIMLGGRLIAVGMRSCFATFSYTIDSAWNAGEQ